MKKLTVCFDDNDALFLENEAAAQKRPFKCHVEFIVVEYIRNKNLNVIQKLEQTAYVKPQKPTHNEHGKLCASNNPDNDPDFIIRPTDSEYTKKRREQGLRPGE